MPNSDLRSWSHRIREFPHREWVLILVLTYAVILAVLASLFLLFEERSNIPIEEETRLLWGPRNLIEVAFFVSQIGVAILAVVALTIAKSHSDHMKQRTEEAVSARKATVYMEINSRYHSAAVTYSRLKLVYFQELHELLRRPEPVGELVHAKLRTMFDDSYARFDETHDGECEYIRTTKLLSFLEDIGLLVERKYVAVEDVVDFMGGVIGMAAQLLQEHMIWLRRRDHDPTLFANALKLMERALSFRYTIYNEGVYRLGSGTHDSTGPEPMTGNDPIPSVA